MMMAANVPPRQGQNDRRPHYHYYQIRTAHLTVTQLRSLWHIHYPPYFFGGMSFTFAANTTHCPVLIF